ncbi:MAG TPA: M15 family metallopeptidase [Amaricoccus sp.]|jgi:hypothetical protein|nr:M15 family metallopeptidase [Amaricoccus sp.]
MKAPGLLGATVIGASVVLAAAVFALVGAVLRDAGGSATEAALARLGDAIATRDGRIADLEAERDALARERDSLRDQLAAASAAAARAPVPASPSAALPTDQFGGTAPPETEDIVDPMELAKGRFNREVIRPTPEVLREVLGEPRQSYSQDCQPVTNPKLVALIETRQIGTFKLSMIRPALDSLQQVVQRLKTEEPDLYAALGTAGALCARYVRGSGRSVSSHAWGAAVDLTLTGELDRMGDASTQFGLVVLAEFFNDAGWYWGAGYGREDSMHFEVGEGLLRQWVAEGRM